MAIEKLPSGSYRATIMYEGKRYRKTFDHKPTQKEIMQEITTKISEKKEEKELGYTFRQAALKYVEDKSDVLSPNTIRDYKRMPDRLSEWFVEMRIDDITQLEINKQVNELSRKLKPKTVHNYHAFISAVLGVYKPDMKIYTTLPQKRKYEPYIPSDSDTKALFNELQGTKFLIPYLLSCFGMRRGEICALDVKDVDATNGIIRVNKSLAFDENKQWVIKSTKTTESEREVSVPVWLAEMIIEQGYVYKGHPNSITDKMGKIEKKLGIEHFSVHKMRHYCASKMIQITDLKTAQKMMGWKSDFMIRQVYGHSIKEEEERARKEAVNKISGSLFE